MLLQVRVYATMISLAAQTLLPQAKRCFARRGAAAVWGEGLCVRVILTGQLASTNRQISLRRSQTPYEIAKS